MEEELQIPREAVGSTPGCSRPREHHPRLFRTVREVDVNLLPHNRRMHAAPIRLRRDVS